MTEKITLRERVDPAHKQVTLQRGLPFAVKVPNAETREALQQSHDREDLTEYETLDAMKAAHR